MIHYTWQQYENDLDDLEMQIIKSEKQSYVGVYGIPRGGIIVARDLMRRLQTHQDKLIYLDRPQEGCLVIDDVCDSGSTLQNYQQYDCATLFYNPKASIRPRFSVKEASEWIEFPWEDVAQDGEMIIQRLLQYVGEDVSRPGLKDTPKRVVKMYAEALRGYNAAVKPTCAIFDNGADGIQYKEMISDTGMFFSFCEHHMLPFFGNYYFAYVPNKKVLGLSKIARIIDYHSARLQIQERLVSEILQHVEEEVQPLGCALVMRARHLCKEMRGVKKLNGFMTTSDMRGCFKDQSATRQEFLMLTNLCIT